ncbi:MAG TPA: CDP-alcohol phosphatidyltransferase family protein [Acidimicrobiales bacterium]|nr:CDP-alcohol phosphatidyltransferase family protein [Acidimicrobiales bacterium]
MDEGLEAATRPAFGPSALATPANALSLARILGAPLLFAAVFHLGPSGWSLAAWVALAATDGVDGWVARRQGTTTSGAFLDPLADKVALLAALAALAARGQLWWLPVTLIAGREAWMSLYRASAGRRGLSVPARRSAKAKTWLQDAAVALALVPPVAGPHPEVVSALLWAAVAATLATGAQYLLDARRAGR